MLLLLKVEWLIDQWSLPHGCGMKPSLLLTLNSRRSILFVDFLYLYGPDKLLKKKENYLLKHSKSQTFLNFTSFLFSEKALLSVWWWLWSTFLEGKQFLLYLLFMFMFFFLNIVHLWWLLLKSCWTTSAVQSMKYFIGATESQEKSFHI